MVILSSENRSGMRRCSSRGSLSHPTFVSRPVWCSSDRKGTQATLLSPIKFHLKPIYDESRRLVDNWGWSLLKPSLIDPSFTNYGDFHNMSDPSLFINMQQIHEFAGFDEKLRLIAVLFFEFCGEVLRDVMGISGEVELASFRWDYWKLVGWERGDRGIFG